MSCGPVCAQSNFKDGEYTVNENVYTVINTKGSKYKRVSIKENNQFIEKLLEDKRGFANLDGFKFSGSETVESALVKSFGKQRIMELSKENAMPVYMYADYQGNIVAVEVRIDANSQIKIDELDRFIVYLKKHVSVILPSTIKPGLNIPSVVRVIRFKTVLEKGSTLSSNYEGL